jgi:hypothetical protein
MGQIRRESSSRALVPHREKTVVALRPPPNKMKRARRKTFSPGHLDGLDREDYGYSLLVCELELECGLDLTVIELTWMER